MKERHFHIDVNPYHKDTSTLENVNAFLAPSQKAIHINEKEIRRNCFTIGKNVHVS